MVLTYMYHSSWPVVLWPTSLTTNSPVIASTVCSVARVCPGFPKSLWYFDRYLIIFIACESMQLCVTDVSLAAKIFVLIIQRWRQHCYWPRFYIFIPNVDQELFRREVLQCFLSLERLTVEDITSDVFVVPVRFYPNTKKNRRIARLFDDKRKI